MSEVKVIGIGNDHAAVDLKMCIRDRFNSLSKQQTKLVNFISHICAFSRGALNVRSTRSHPTLAPRPQIWLMKFTGFCAVAGEDELNRGEDLGTEADIFCLL